MGVPVVNRDATMHCSGKIFGATPAMFGQNLPHLVGINTSWNRVKVSENLSATEVAPVAPTVKYLVKVS